MTIGPLVKVSNLYQFICISVSLFVYTSSLFPFLLQTIVHAQYKMSFDSYLLICNHTINYLHITYNITICYKEKFYMGPHMSKL